MKIDAPGVASNSDDRYNYRITVAANQGGRKYMEDRVHIETIKNDDGAIKFIFLGIFDGHGGYEASEFVRRHLLTNIMACELFESERDQDILDAIQEGFLTTHEEMKKVVANWPRTASGYASTAGTTASVAIIRNGKIYTGHVGDSAVIMSKYTTINGDKVGLEAERLTIDHKPESVEEMTRIELAGGRVAQKSGVSRVVWTRPVRGHVGPVRKNTPTESIPFLAVARSLGDLWSYCESTGKYVVSPYPDLAVRPLTDDDSCLVLVSDGITNVLTPLQIIQYVEAEERRLLVGEDKDPNDLHDKQPNHARVLLSHTMKRWGGLRADNLSAIVLIMDAPNANPKAYLPYVDEPLAQDQSIDEMFLMDPECMIHLTANKTQKLWTERVPLLYEGALDNNFVSVDYRGPGFMTHDEEDEIETRMLMREQMRESYKSTSPPKDIAEPVNNNVEPGKKRSIQEAKENLDVTPAKIPRLQEGESSIANDDDGHSDEETPEKDSAALLASLPSTTPSATKPSPPAPKTRSSAKHIVELNMEESIKTPSRKIAIASRRLSLIKTDNSAGAVLTVESAALTMTPGVVTRSQERIQNAIVFATPSASTSIISSPFVENGSRKRPSRLASTSAGVTPIVERLRLETPAKREADSEPIVRSEPTTPAKSPDNSMRASNWSLSKLDELRAADDSAEPPSKIRKFYGFMKRLVGLGNSS